MKSVQIKKYGSSEVIEINQTAPEPVLSVGKVLVIVKAAGVNPIDWKIREGYMQQKIQLQFPSTLGMDFSGVIKQVGEGVSVSNGEKRYMDRRQCLLVAQERCRDSSSKGRYYCTQTRESKSC